MQYSYLLIELVYLFLFSVILYNNYMSLILRCARLLSSSGQKDFYLSLCAFFLPSCGQTYSSELARLNEKHGHISVLHIARTPCGKNVVHFKAYYFNFSGSKHLADPVYVISMVSLYIL